MKSALLLYYQSSLRNEGVALCFRLHRNHIRWALIELITMTAQPLEFMNNTVAYKKMGGNKWPSNETCLQQKQYIFGSL